MTTPPTPKTQPDLPPHAGRLFGAANDDHDGMHGYTAEQMRDYALAALAAQPPAVAAIPEGWQPIETAPKDGTKILLGATPQAYCGQPVAARSTQGYWDAQTALPSDYASDSGEFIGEPDGVPFWMSEDGGFTEENPPTHWQPMPAPPEFDDTGVAALPPIGTPGYRAALIALPHDYPLTLKAPTLASAVLSLNSSWNKKEPEDVIAGHLDLCRRLAMIAAAPQPPAGQQDCNHVANVGNMVQQDRGEAVKGGLLIRSADRGKSDTNIDAGNPLLTPPATAAPGNGEGGK